MFSLYSIYLFIFCLDFSIRFGLQWVVIVCMNEKSEQWIRPLFCFPTEQKRKTNIFYTFSFQAIISAFVFHKHFLLTHIRLFLVLLLNRRVRWHSSFFLLFHFRWPLTSGHHYDTRTINYQRRREKLWSRCLHTIAPIIDDQIRVKMYATFCIHGESWQMSSENKPRPLLSVYFRLADFYFS